MFSSGRHHVRGGSQLLRNGAVAGAVRRPAAAGEGAGLGGGAPCGPRPQALVPLLSLSGPILRLFSCISEGRCHHRRPSAHFLPQPESSKHVRFHGLLGWLLQSHAGNLACSSGYAAVTISRYRCPQCKNQISETATAPSGTPRHLQAARRCPSRGTYALIALETRSAWHRRHDDFNSSDGTDVSEGHEGVASPRARSLSSGGDRRSCDRRSCDGGDTELGLSEARPRQHPQPGARRGARCFIYLAEQCRPPRHVLSLITDHLTLQLSFLPARGIRMPYIRIGWRQQHQRSRNYGREPEALTSVLRHIYQFYRPVSSVGVLSS